MAKMKLSVKALALSFGIVWAAGVFLLGIMAIRGYGANIVSALGSVYLGYKPTFVGSIIGGVWGAIDGGIAGAILAWLYNHFV